MKKRIFSLTLRLAISGILVGYYLHILSQRFGGIGPAFSRIVNAFTGTHTAWLIPAALLHLVGFALISLRWKKLLQAQAISARFSQLYILYIMAAFFNLVLPSTIGGDAVRTIESKRITRTGSSALMVIVVERLSGLVALLVIAWFALGFQLITGGAIEWLLLVVLLVLLAAILLLMALGHPRVIPVIIRWTGRVLPHRITAKLEEAQRALAVYYRNPRYLAAALGISIVFQLNMVLYYYLLARALGQTPSLLDFMIKVPIMIVLLMTIPSINGLGVRTFSFGQLMGFPVLLAVAAELIDLTFRIGYGLVGGVLFMVYRRRGATQDQAESPEELSTLPGLKDQSR